MPIYRPTTLDAIHLDGVLSLDLDRGRAVVELAQVSFVDAYALAGLACFIASAARDGLPVELVLPENIDVRSWLSRRHLGEVLDAFEVRVEGVLPRVAERDRRDTLIELERFDDSFGSHRLASFIWERLAGGVDGEVVNQLFEAAGELGQNVVEHAGSPVGGFYRRPALQGRSTRGADRRGGGGCGRRHPGVASGAASRMVTRGQARTFDVSRLDRQAGRLIIKGAPERTVELARRAAHNRGVADRLEAG